MVRHQTGNKQLGHMFARYRAPREEVVAYRGMDRRLFRRRQGSGTGVRDQGRYPEAARAGGFDPRADEEVQSVPRLGQRRRRHSGGDRQAAIKPANEEREAIEQGSRPIRKVLDQPLAHGVAFQVEVKRPVAGKDALQILSSRPPSCSIGF